MVSVDVKHHVYLHIFFADNRLSETCSISEAVPKGSKDPTALLQSDRHQNLDSRTSLPAVVRFRQLDTRCWQNWFQYDYLHPSCWFCYIFMSFFPPLKNIFLFLTYLSFHILVTYDLMAGLRCVSVVTAVSVSHWWLTACVAMELHFCYYVSPWCYCAERRTICVCVCVCVHVPVPGQVSVCMTVCCASVSERERDWLRERRFRPTKPANS